MTDLYDETEVTHPMPLRLIEAQRKIARLRAERDRLRAAHEKNARILEYLVNELQGRVEGGKLEALFACLDRSRAALKGDDDE